MDRKGNLIFAVLSAVLLLCGAISTDSTTETTAATTTPPTTTAAELTTNVTSTESTTISSETDAPITTANHSTTTEATETPTTTAEQTTQTPWPTFGPYQYFLSQTSETELNFDAAEKECLKWGGNLVSIYNETENDFIKSSVTLNYNGTAWIGLQQTNGGYNWTDGSTFDYTNNLEVPDSNTTDSNSTDSGATQCFALNTTDDSNWFNVSCETIQPAYLCKRPLESTETPTEGPGGGGGGGGLSNGAVIAVSVALVLVVLTLALGGVYYIIKRKRKPKMDAFTLLDNDQCDFANSNTVTLGDSY